MKADYPNYLKTCAVNKLLERPLLNLWFVYISLLGEATEKYYYKKYKFDPQPPIMLGQTV
jgi:hypothetical protein